jgi:hypothetical protein
MIDAPSFFAPPALAHLCKPIRHGFPQLCKTTSTFPRMTAGPVPCILESIQVSRAIHGFARKGRDHVQTSSYWVTAKPGRGSPLQLLRRTAPDRANFESGLVAGILKVSGCDGRASTVPGLPPEPQCASHRVFCQRSHVGHRLVANSCNRPALSPNSLSLEGSRQETSPAGPLFVARANGRRNDL